MRNERLIPRHTPESREAAERTQVVMDLTSRLNVLRHNDVDGRTAILGEILGRPVPGSLRLFPPFYCDFGLNLDFGDDVFVNQNCSFFDMGGISIGDRALIGPGVTLATAGHPVDPARRFDGITVAPIVIEANVWIGANATVCPGVTIGEGAVVAAGALIAKDVAANCVVSGHSHVVRRGFSPAP